MSDNKKSLLVQLAEKFERTSGRRNRVSKAILEAHEVGIDLDKLMLLNCQTTALLAGGHLPTDERFDAYIGDQDYLDKLREGFDGVEEKLLEAGPWTTGSMAFRYFVGRVPPPMRRLIPPDSYEGALWRAIVQIENVENFKLQTRLRLEDLAEYKPVPEGGEYNTSPREGYAVFYWIRKYGLEVALTWEMIVNDDMRAFSDLSRHLVLSGLHSINSYIWGAIVANPLIWTGNSLFNLAHNNLMTTALSVAALGTARSMMNRHTSSGGKPIDGVNPAYCIIPPELEQTLDIILQSSAIPTAGFSAGVYNPEGGKLNKIMTRYLVNTNDWYLWCEPSAAPVMEVGFLFGRDTPEIDQNDVWEREEVHYRGKYCMGHCFKGYKGALLSTVSLGTS